MSKAYRPSFDKTSTKFPVPPDAKRFLLSCEDWIGDRYDDNMYAEARDKGWDMVLGWQEAISNGDKTLKQVKNEWAKYVRGQYQYGPMLFASAQSNLRSKLIRLAASNSTLRPHLLPILRES